MPETTRYYRFNDLRPDQQQQARDRFPGYRLDAYRYELDRDGDVLCRWPDALIGRQGAAHRGRPGGGPFSLDRRTSGTRPTPTRVG